MDFMEKESSKLSSLLLLNKTKPIVDWNLLNPTNFEKMNWKFGQATLVDEHNIYIFGGVDLWFKNNSDSLDSQDDKKVLYNQKLNISRQWTSQLLRYNTNKNELSVMPQGEYIIAPKRDHWIAQYGRFIVSFGGINYLGKVIDDVDIYDTEFGFWEPLKLTNPIEGLWYSTWTSCFYPDRFLENKSKVEIDSIPSPNWGKVEHLIKEEGIYLFGGRNK